MFEASLTQVVVLKKIVESLKDLVTEVNLEATPTGMTNILIFRSFFTSYGQRTCIFSLPPTKREWF